MPTYRVDGQKRRFSNTISSWHTSYRARPVRLAIVIPFFVASSCGRAKTSSNTLRVEGYFFYNGQKNLLFQKYPDTCGRGLKVWKKKTTTRKSLQFVRKKSGYSGKKRMDDSLKNVGLPYATKMSRVWIHRKGPQLIYLRKSENCAKCLKRSFIGIVLHGSVKNSEQLYGGKFSSTHRYIWSALKFMPACSFVQDVRLRRAISMLDAKQPMKFREFRSDCKVGITEIFQ